MKIYRQPFRKTLATSELFVFIVVLFVLIIPSALSGSFNLSAFLLLMVFFILFLHIIVIQLFYIILTKDTLVIKNSIYPFWIKKVRYGDIVKVKIRWTNKRFAPNMQVFTKKNSIFRWRYIIDYVAPQDYPEIIEELETRGVLVETKDIDTYITMMENTNRKAK